MAQRSGRHLPSRTACSRRASAEQPSLAGASRVAGGNRYEEIDAWMAFSGARLATAIHATAGLEDISKIGFLTFVLAMSFRLENRTGALWSEYERR